jgi:4'-phosphopantetheinyl transferase
MHQRESFRRSVLADALGVETGRLVFESDPFGRPRLDGELADRASFSCASTKGLMAIAFAGSGCIGVDVERLDASIVDDALCAAALAAEEVGSLDSTAGRATAFFDVWTRKEAVMKAAGRGLRWDPRSVVVCGKPGDDGWIRARTPDMRTWWVRSLPEYNGCSIAVALDRPADVDTSRA